MTAEANTSNEPTTEDAPATGVVYEDDEIVLWGM